VRSLPVAQKAYTNEIAEGTAQAALVSASRGVISGFVLKEAKSPWAEKIRLRRTWEYIEAELHIWMSPEFLAARINRLALFALDSLDPGFAFDMDAMVALRADARIRRAHNHIWTIYVDSRIERMALDNFFDRSLRRNLFVDSQRAHPWSVSDRVFDQLWRKEHFTHPEIIDYARRLEEIMADGVQNADSRTFEVEMSHYRGDYSALDCVKAIPSQELKEAANRLLDFVSNTCRGTLIEPCYYGIRFIHQGIVLAEMVTSKRDSLLVTLFDVPSQNLASYALGTDSRDIENILAAVKGIYDAISRHSQRDHSEEPLRFPM
jgi:hypothetical protein